MTIDLWMLVASALLCEIQILTAATPALKDPKVGFGNREGMEDPTGLWGRALRASNNMKENLPLFAILVLTAHVAGEANGMTAIGAEVFFGARVGHWLTYMAGIPGLRTLLWAVSMVGMGLIASQLVM